MHIGVNCGQLSQGCYAALPRSELNPRPIDRKFNALSLRHCAIQSQVRHASHKKTQNTAICQYCFVRPHTSRRTDATTWCPEMPVMSSGEVLERHRRTASTESCSSKCAVFSSQAFPHRPPDRAVLACGNQIATDCSGHRGIPGNLATMTFATTRIM